MGGISATTLTDMMLAQGAYVTVGGTDMGALTGTVHFWVEVEEYHPDLYGAKGDIKATGFVTRAVPHLSFQMAELEYAKFQEIWHHIGHSSDANSEKVGGGVVGKLDATDEYQTVQVLGATLHDGNVVEITVDNARVVSNPDLTLSDRENTFIEVELVGSYLATTPTTLPAYVQIDKG